MQSSGVVDLTQRPESLEIQRLPQTPTPVARDDEDRQVLADIAQIGWHMIGIEQDDEGPRFVLSCASDIGLCNVPVGSERAAVPAPKHVNPCNIMKAVFPEPLDRILDDLREERLAVPVRSPACELITGP